MNVIVQLAIKLTYYDSTVQYFNHYTTKTPPDTISPKVGGIKEFMPFPKSEPNSRTGIWTHWLWGCSPAFLIQMKIVIIAAWNLKKSKQFKGILACMCVCVCIYIYIYIYIHTHTQLCLFVHICEHTPLPYFPVDGVKVNQFLFMVGRIEAFTPGSTCTLI